MNALQFNNAMKTGLYQLLLGILNLGNITFTAGPNETSVVDTKCHDSVNSCVHLFDVNAMNFNKCMTEKYVQMGGGGSMIAIQLNPIQALDNRDSLSKALYSAMFDWVIKQVNVSLKSNVPIESFVGILDIFGFEVFEINRFEQLCINYASK